MRHTVTEHTLTTGTKGLLIDVPGSEVIDIKLIFRAGYQFGDFSKYEVPHLIEHHVLNATKNYPAKDQIKTEIARNGAYLNASTGPDHIMYLAECAEFEVVRVLELLTEVVARPLFPAEFYETERENVRTELTHYLSDYPRQVYRLSEEASFPKLIMRYERRLKQLDSITHDDVVNHYHATHTARNSSFIVSGAVAANKSAIIKKLEHLYGELPLGTRNNLRDDIGLGMDKPIVGKEKIDSVYFSLNWYAGGLSDSERAAGRLLSSILTGGYSSRVYGKAREEGLTYHISSSQDYAPKSSDFAFRGFCNPSKWPRLLELIATEAQDVAKNGPTELEVEDAKRRLVGGITRVTQTAGDIAGWYTGDYSYYGKILPYDDYFELIQAASPADIQAMAKHYFSSDRHNATMVGNIGTPEINAVGDNLASIWS